MVLYYKGILSFFLKNDLSNFLFKNKYYTKLKLYTLKDYHVIF